MSTYNVIRSFNQFLNGTLSLGTDQQLILNPYPSQKELDRDTVSVHFFDERVRELHGRRVGGSDGRIVDSWCQIDVWSPPNSSGEPRNGANRTLKDTVESVFKPKVRIPLINYGTAGTTEVGGMYVRQESASWLPVEDMKNWCRWSLTYRIRAVDTD